MICKGCRKAAKALRKAVDHPKKKVTPKFHPLDCNCPCQHRSGPWEKLFSVERPK